MVKDYHCTAHVTVYHCRPDDRKKKFDEYGYGYWDGLKGPEKKKAIIGEKSAESKKLYDNFDYCKNQKNSKIQTEINKKFGENAEKACKILKSTQIMPKK